MDRNCFTCLPVKKTTKTGLLLIVGGTSTLHWHSYYLQEEKSQSIPASYLLKKTLSCHLLFPPSAGLCLFVFLFKCNFISARQLPCFSLFLLLSLLGVRGRLWQLWSKLNVCLHSSHDSGQGKPSFLADNTLFARLSLYWHHCIHKPFPPFLWIL